MVALATRWQILLWTLATFASDYNQTKSVCSGVDRGSRRPLNQMCAWFSGYATERMFSGLERTSANNSEIVLIVDLQITRQCMRKRYPGRGGQGVVASNTNWLKMHLGYFQFTRNGGEAVCTLPSLQLTDGWVICFPCNFKSLQVHLKQNIWLRFGLCQYMIG